MADFSIRITGLRELDQKLGQLAAEDVKQIVRDGLMAGGEVFWAAVTENAVQLTKSPYRSPKTDALPLGMLAADIQVRFAHDQYGHPAAIIGPGKYTRHVARFVEYGHRLLRGGRTAVLGGLRKRLKQHLRDAEGNLIDVPAYPFIRPAYEASVEDAVNVAIEVMRQGVEKAAAKR